MISTLSNRIKELYESPLFQSNSTSFKHEAKWIKLLTQMYTKLYHWDLAKQTMPLFSYAMKDLAILLDIFEKTDQDLLHQDQRAQPKQGRKKAASVIEKDSEP